MLVTLTIFIKSFITEYILSLVCKYLYNIQGLHNTLMYKVNKFSITLLRLRYIARALKMVGG